MLRISFSWTTIIILALLCICGCASFEIVGGKKEPVLILPQPKELELLGESWELQDCAIVIGSAATEVEKYAAEMLSSDIEKRFGVKLGVRNETENLGNLSQLIVLGTNQTNQFLNQISGENNIELTETRPASDDFVIKMVDHQEKQQDKQQPQPNR